MYIPINTVSLFYCLKVGFDASELQGRVSTMFHQDSTPVYFTPPYTPVIMSSERLNKLSERLINSSERVIMSSERLIMFALKFSRSPYLYNHLSEGIHTWTICTLCGWLSFHAIGPQGPCPGKGVTGSKSSTCSKCGISELKFSRSSYLDNHLSESIHTWTKGTL